METPHARTPGIAADRQQRTLAAIVAAVGLLIGAMVGAAVAQTETEAATAPATETPAVGADAGAAPAGAAVSVPASGVVADPAAAAVPVSAVVVEGAVEGATRADVAPAAPDLVWSDEADDDAGGLPLVPLIAKVSLGLGLVVLLAWGTVYLLRRTAFGQGVASGSSAVRVVDRNWLGPKKAIYLVDISGRTLALGVTEEHISVLSTWEPGQIEVQAPEPVAGAFAHQLKSMLQRGRGETAAAGGQR